MREMRKSGATTTGEAFLRQLSVGGGGGGVEYTSYSSARCCNSETRRGSKRWGRGKKDQKERGPWARQQQGGGGGGGSGCAAGMVVARKRVMVVIDQSGRAKQAMMWALTHVANKGDHLTLLHVVSPYRRDGGDDVPNLANSLGSLCKACKPEVEVEALVIQGPKLATVINQVRKLEASVLVLSQPKPSPFCCLYRNSGEEFVEQCIDKAECLTLAVRKQSKGMGGYLVSTRWQKNFWLLA